MVYIGDIYTYIWYIELVNYIQVYTSGLYGLMITLW